MALEEIPNFGARLDFTTACILINTIHIYSFQRLFMLKPTAVDERTVRRDV
jgi:hypothetical protein